MSWHKDGFPYVIGSAIMLIWQCSGYAISFPETMLSSGITYGSIVTCFLVTVTTMMISIYKAPQVKEFKKYLREKDYPFERYLFEAFWLALMVIIFSFVGFFSLAAIRMYQSFWLALMVTSFFSFARCVFVLFIFLYGLRHDS